MRNSGGDYTGNSGHERIVLPAMVIVKREMRMVSLYFEGTVSRFVSGTTRVFRLNSGASHEMTGDFP